MCFILLGNKPKKKSNNFKSITSTYFCVAFDTNKSFNT